MQQAEDGFGQAIDRIMAALREAGYTLDVRRRLATFAQLTITDTQGRATDLDLGVDWRANPPVRLEVGAVLALDDAVGNKVAALFSRAETRDYLDVDAIRRSGRFTDAELLALGEQADAGFDREQFANTLDAVRRVEPEEVGVYRVTADALAGIKQRMTTWASSLRVADVSQIPVESNASKTRIRTAGSPAATSPGKSSTNAGEWISADTWACGTARSCSRRRRG